MTTPIPPTTNSATSRWLTLLPAMFVASMIFVLSSVPGNHLSVPLPAGSDKIAHALVYALFGAAIAYPISHSRRYRYPLLGLFLVVVIGAVYGVSDEIHQMFTPMRSPDPYDVLADVIGSFLGAITFFGVRRWITHQTRSKKQP